MHASMNDFKMVLGRLPMIENEVFATYLSQAMPLLSADSRKVLNSLVKGGVASISLSYPRRIIAFKEAVGDCIPPTDTVIRQNSSIQPMKLTCSTQNYERLYDHVLHGTRTGVGPISGASRKRRMKGLLNYKIGTCLECLVEDRSTFGRNYVKRQHVLSSVSVCTKHKSPLFMSCERCRGLDAYKKRLFHLSSQCACGASLVPCVDATNKELMKSEIRLSEAVDALYKLGEIPHIDYRHVHNAYRHQATSLGLLDNWRNGVDICQLAEERLHRHVLERDVVHWGYGRATQMLMFGKGYLNDIMQNAIVICTLFDDAATFQAEVTKSASMNIEGLLLPRVRPKAATAKGLASECEKYKASIQAFRRLNPHASRTEVRRACSYEMRALLHHEPAALDVLLPAPQRNSSAPARAKAARERRRAEDAIIAPTIRIRRSEWMANPPAFRLSGARLMKGLTTYLRLRTYPSDFTETLKAVEECSETREQFEMRKLFASGGTLEDKL